MHDVADKVGDAALIGALGAAIAALALACRTRGAKLDVRPTGFPSDANATLKKYENAYLQLVSKSAEHPLQPGSEPTSALDYALIAFEQAMGPSKSAPTAAESDHGMRTKSEPLTKPRQPDPGKAKGKKGGR